MEELLSKPIKNINKSDFMNGKRNILLISISACFAVIILFFIGYFWWKGIKNTETLSRQEAIEDATKGVLPSLSINPLENKPDLNPVEGTNPIKKIKTNPFE